MNPPLRVGDTCSVEHRHASDTFALPQGPSLRSGLCCPKPSSLNRPHPPRSRAHRDFTAWRLIRNAFAVRERLGDPRAVPGFYCAFRPGMPSSKTPGSSTSSVPGSDIDIGLRRGLSGSALPKSPQSVSRGVSISRLPRFAFATACQFARPPVRIRPGFPAVGDFSGRPGGECAPIVSAVNRGLGAWPGQRRAGGQLKSTKNLEAIEVTNN